MLPRLHRGLSSLRLCRAPSSLWHCIGQASSWLHHGLPVPPSPPLFPPLRLHHAPPFLPAPSLSSIHRLCHGMVSPVSTSVLQACSSTMALQSSGVTLGLPLLSFTWVSTSPASPQSVVLLAPLFIGSTMGIHPNGSAFGATVHEDYRINVTEYTVSLISTPSHFCVNLLVISVYLCLLLVISSVLLVLSALCCYGSAGKRRGSSCRNKQSFWKDKH